MGPVKKKKKKKVWEEFSQWGKKITSVIIAEVSGLGRIWIQMQTRVTSDTKLFIIQDKTQKESLKSDKHKVKPKRSTGLSAGQAERTEDELATER